MKTYKYNYDYYHFVNKNGGHTVIAASRYAGRVIKGYAKCDPNDNFDLEKGKELAKARCDEKIALKRRANAVKKYREAALAADEAHRRYNDMAKYFMDATDGVDAAKAKVEEILKTL